MRRLGAIVGGGGGALAAFLLLIGPVNWGAVGNPLDLLDGDPDVSSIPSPTDDVDVDEDVDADVTDDGDGDGQDSEDDGDVDTCRSGRVVADYLYDQGFAKRDFTVGVKIVDWEYKLRHVDQSFSRPLRSEAALENFLDADSAAASAARGLIGDDLVVAGDKWVAVQFQVPVNYSGNWHWNGHKAIKGGDLRVPTGDVWWLNVSSECEVEASDSVRAACGNVGLDRLRPAYRQE